MALAPPRSLPPLGVGEVVRLRDRPAVAWAALPLERFSLASLWTLANPEPCKAIENFLASSSYSNKLGSVASDMIVAGLCGQVVAASTVPRLKGKRDMGGQIEIKFRHNVCG